MVWLLGWLWWVLIPVRKRLAVAAYRRCFPHRDPGELRRTVGVVAWSYVELLRGRRGTLHGREHLPEHGGAIALAGHLAAWDMALISGAQHVPATIFVRQPSNRLAAWLVDRLRGTADIELLPPTGAMAAAYAALERGRLVIFVQDQRHNRGIPVAFFGQPALTSPAFAAMAWRTRAPVVGIDQWRDDAGAHHVRIRPLQVAVPEGRDEALQVLTAFSQRYYEGCIRQRPWAWWWLHARWRDGDRPPDDLTPPPPSTSPE